MGFRDGCRFRRVGRYGSKMLSEDQEVLKCHRSFQIEVTLQVGPIAQTEFTDKDQEVAENHHAIAVEISWTQPEFREYIVSLC